MRVKRKRTGVCRTCRGPIDGPNAHLRVYCPGCSERAAAPKNRPAGPTQAERYRTNLGAALDAFEAHGGRCLDCPQDDYRLIDWHHEDPATKAETLSVLLRIGTLEAVEAELSKCVPLCCACHRLRHAEGSWRAAILADVLAERRTAG